MLMSLPFFSIVTIDAHQKAAKEYRKRLEIQLQINSDAPKLDPQETILFLRPFTTDVNGISKSRLTGKKYKDSRKNKRNQFIKVKCGDTVFTDLESVLCYMVSECGEVVAIGDPYERNFNSTVISGVYRIYTENRDWKELVHDYMEKCKFIIIYVDFTDGTQWEIEQIIKNYKNKTIFIPRLYYMHKKVEIGLFNFLFVKHLVFKYHRRGKKYYKEWEKLFNFKIDDTVSTVFFKNETAIFSVTRTGFIDAQLNAIQNGMREFHTYGYSNGYKKVEK